MSKTLADRIQDRMDFLGTNPSAVALEAGLNRAAVRDILMGKSQSPRIDTLQKLTGPLECTLDYLLGESDHPNEETYDRRYIEHETEVVPAEHLDILEAGVFRPIQKPDLSTPAPVREVDRSKPFHIKIREPRLPGWNTSLYAMGDNSLSHRHILKGDILSVAKHPDEAQLPLTQGLLVMVRYVLAGREIEEKSARQVHIIDGDVHLTCSPDTGIQPIIIKAPDLENESALLANYYLTEDSASVWIEGVVARITREIDIGSLYEISRKRD